MRAVYEDLQEANGNDLIEEQDRLQQIILKALNDNNVLADYDRVTRELTLREEL